MMIRFQSVQYPLIFFSLSFLESKRLQQLANHAIKIKIKSNKYNMENMEDNKIIQAYQKSQQLESLFHKDFCSSSFPLTYQDSLSPVPDHPSCAIGTLTSQAEWGSRKGVAFVVEDNYLLTCASNCYSHMHGQDSNITFTIDSHRKHGNDTHKVTKVFIPQQYKQLPQSKSNQYNYALLFIEGKPNMIDRYGSIGIVFNSNEIGNSFQQSIKCRQSQLLQFESEPPKIQEQLVMNGQPLINGNKAVGLVCTEGEETKPYYLPFNEEVHSQLAQWVKVPNGQFKLQCLTVNEMDASCLNDKEIRPIRSVNLQHCKIDKRKYSFFEELPFSDISELDIYNFENESAIIGDRLWFLSLAKFKDLKILSLKSLHIGPEDCKYVVSLSLCNLRELSLAFNPIGDIGCKHLSKADWPFLVHLDLCDCQIGNEGVMLFLQSKRRNLFRLNLGYNILRNDLSKIFQKADLPRINNLSIEKNCIKQLGLAFLKTQSWKKLTVLSLDKNPIGSKGCKMIKEAGLVLRKLSLNWCIIDSIGFKWIFKANLTNLFILSAFDNFLGDKGCFALVRAHMPNLNGIDLRRNGICIKGMKLLLEARWAKQAFNNEKHKSFRYLIKQSGMQELEKCLYL